MLKSYWTNTSRVHLAMVLACLGLIGITWAVTIERIRFDRAETIANAVKQNANLAIAFEEQTIRTLKGVEQAVLFVKNRYEEHGLKLNIRGMIDDGTIDASLFTFIGITDERGGVVFGSLEFKPTNLVDRESFKVHQQNNDNEMFIGQPTLGRITHRWAIPMSHRINKTDGSFGGIVYASVDPEYFTGFYRKADLGEQGVVTLIGLDGIVRAGRVGQKGTFGWNMRDSKLFVEQAKSRVGGFLGEAKLDGVVRFLSYRTLTQYPLIVVVGISEAETLAPFFERRRGYYMSAGFAGTMIVIFTAFMMVAWSRQQRTLDSLLESEARFRATFDQRAVGVAHTTLDGRLIKANAKVSEILGYTSAELSAMTLGDVVLREDFERTQSNRARLISGEIQEVVGDARCVRKDRSVGWVVYGLSVVRDPSGEPQYFIYQIMDITARKQSEQAALAQFKLAETFFNDSVGCFVILDPNFNFLRVNAAYAAACRRDISEFPGRNHFEVYPSDAKAIFEEVVRTKRPIETFTRAFTFADQPERGLTYWDWTLVPILDEQGEVEYLVFSLNEVTERKRAEAALRQSLHRVQALSERVMKIQQEERDGIARELHDELGQTLTALKVNLQMLEPYCTGGDAEDHLTEALMIVGRALKQVRGMMLDLRPPELEDIGLAATLESHFAKQAEAAGWVAHFEALALPGRLRPELEMACFRVAQEALTNVMRHAHAKEVWVVLGLNGGEVELSVRDDGIGFDVAAVSDHPLSPSFGLIGMQERARQMGGRLSVHSAVGCGTEVRATFPCAAVGSQA